MSHALTPNQLSQLLAKTIAARVPVLVVGSPGVGKSQIIERAARSAGADLLISHPVVNDPTDARGLPWPDSEHQQARFLPFGDLARALESTRPLVWFLDDLGQASPAVQASYMQLLLSRRVNGHVLPEHVVFVAASNGREHRAGVSGMLEPVKSRFGTIVELVPQLEDWVAWAYQNDIPSVVIAFLRYRVELLCQFEPRADLSTSPVPRAWESVGRLFNLALPESVTSSAYCGAVGDGAGTEFAAFVRTYAALPSIDAILKDPDAAPIPTEPDEQYAICCGLAYRSSANTFHAVARYVERLHRGGYADFAVMTVKDAMVRDASVRTSPAFHQLLRGDLGRSIVECVA